MNEKIPLEKALQSPDTVVRRAAIRRMEIDNEIGKLDSFLTFYAGSEVDPGVSDSPKLSEPVNGAAGRQPTSDVKARSRRFSSSARRAPIEPKAPRIGKGTRLADAVKIVLIGHGKPMQLEELFNALKGSHADLCPGKIDSLRPRLHEQREKITLIKGTGYWPAGTEVPV
jgi:hypothetical protein